MHYNFGHYLPDSKLFFNLENLPLTSLYTFSVLLFMIENRNQFMVHSEIYHIDTRQHAYFIILWIILNTRKEYYWGVKVINMLPSYIKIESDNPKKFKLILQNFFKFL